MRDLPAVIDERHGHAVTCRLCKASAHGSKFSFFAEPPEVRSHCACFHNRDRSELSWCLERPRAYRSAAAASLCAVVASDPTHAKLETVPEVCSTSAASFSAAASSASEQSSAFDPRLEPPTFWCSRLHPSQCFDHRRGIIICLRCGFIAVSKARSYLVPAARCP